MLTMKGSKEHVNYINQDVQQKAVKYISMCLYVRTSVVTYKSAYSDQCVCYFYEILCIVVLQTYLKFFSVNISTTF